MGTSLTVPTVHIGTLPSDLAEQGTYPYRLRSKNLVFHIHQENFRGRSMHVNL